MSHSAHLALVGAQHQRCLDDVRQRLHLLVAEHRLEHGEDTLRRGRVGCEGKDDLRCLRPHRELGAVRPDRPNRVLPPKKFLPNFPR